MANKKENSELMEKIVSLCKRRGFVFPGSEIYGGLANSWDYGPLGVELKNNIKSYWWKKFVHHRDDMVGIDAALIMNPKVWEASGHLDNFSDPLVECKKCHSRFRADQIGWTDSKSSMKDIACPECSASDWSDTKQFNMMLKTFLGPAEESVNTVYFRPETAQAMFVDFKNVLQTSRKRIPFGIAQIGKAFRNEITPGNFIFRTREFEQMEIEYFIRESDWETFFEHWRREMLSWMKEVGINLDMVHEVEISEEDRAFYSKRTIDFEFDFPFGQKELFGLAYRTDYDLKKHEKASGEDLKYKTPEARMRCSECGIQSVEFPGGKNSGMNIPSSCPKCGGNRTPEGPFVPHVIEPTWGVDRAMLAILVSAYQEDGDPAKSPNGDNGAGRVYLKLKPSMAPYKVAVFPLLANNPELVDKAREIYDLLRKDMNVAWDDRGNVGKRYYSQDEIGTPYCITVDFDTLGEKGEELKDTVTVRDRDTAKQDRIKIGNLKNYLEEKIR